MPLNKEGQEVAYTSSEEVGYLMESSDKDYNVEFIGYIKAVHGRCTAVLNKVETEFFKCIITNGTEKLTLLIWDATKINELSGELIADRIVHLDRCEGQVVTKRRQHEANDLLNYEIIIQPGSVVEFKGFHVHHQSKKEALIKSVEFLDIPKAVGQIKVKAYIKTVVGVAYNRDGPLGFGSGSITEGIHKLPVRVTTFKAEDSAKHDKGLCAMITGTVSRTDPLTLICQNISSFELLEGEKPLDKEVVSKANKPLKRGAPSNKNDSAQNTKRFVLKETNL